MASCVTCATRTSTKIISYADGPTSRPASYPHGLLRPAPGGPTGGASMGGRGRPARPPTRRSLVDPGSPGQSTGQRGISQARSGDQSTQPARPPGDALGCPAPAGKSTCAQAPTNPGGYSAHSGRSDTAHSGKPSTKPTPWTPRGSAAGDGGFAPGPGRPALLARGAVCPA
jgi:hypothetical protein